MGGNERMRHYPEPRAHAARVSADARAKPGCGRATGAAPAPGKLGRNLADVAKKLERNLARLVVAVLECLFSGLDDRAAQRPDTECRSQVAELTNLGGKDFRGHASDDI